VRWLGVLGVLVFAGCSDQPALPQQVVALCATPVPLTAAEVETIIAQAAARAAADQNAQVITVVNRAGVIVGQFRMAGLAPGFEDSCLAKARTAGFLSSNRSALSTRTARFLSQDHYPPGVDNAPGGPLYGALVSSLTCSDVVGELSGNGTMTGNGLSDEFGSMPLYKEGCLVGAVAADGGIDSEAEERAAWAGTVGFRPDPALRGPAFVENTPPDPGAAPPLGAIPGTLVVAPADAPPEMAFPLGIFGGHTCEIRYPIIDSPSTEPVRLVSTDVAALLDAAARAGLFVAVSDPAGNVLGCIRTPDAALFSFDLSIQKARTAAYFSSDAAAFTTRAIGFMAQAFFPPGANGTPLGPLHGLQDAMAVDCLPATLPVQNGIAILPGGVPLYKAGLLVGAIGTSGDATSDNDTPALQASQLFPAPDPIRCDNLFPPDAVTELRAKAQAIAAAATTPALIAAANSADARLSLGLRFLPLPY